MPKVFFLNFLPIRCPGCGEVLQFGRDARSDFFAGASHSCECGTKFQYIDDSVTEKVARENGDMMSYIK